MMRMNEYAAVGTFALVAGCGAAGDVYHCRVTNIYDTEMHNQVDTPTDGPQFTFTVTDESDIYVAGAVPGVWRNRNGELPFVTVSKLDGQFSGMQVQLSDQKSVYFEGFCKPR